MPKDLFEFDCPCCGERIEIHTRSGKARAVDPKKDKRNDLDVLIDEQGHASERLGLMFENAKSDQTDQAKKLDALFDDATEQAKREPHKKPENPFDFE